MLAALEELLLEDDYWLFDLICEAVPVGDWNKLAKAMVLTYGNHGEGLAMVRRRILREIDATDKARGNTLFRTNSIATKMNSAYALRVGIPYIQATFSDPIAMIEEDPGGYEINTEKAKKKKVKANQENVKWMVDALMTNILQSVERLPAGIRAITHALSEGTSIKFPEMTRIAVGGFIFLRFIVPCLASPQAFGLVDGDLSDELKSGMLIISRIIQALANNQEFGDKDPSLVFMNEVLVELRPKMERFLEDLGRRSTSRDPEHGGTLTPDEREANLKIIHKALTYAKAKISNIITGDSIPVRTVTPVGQAAGASTSTHPLRSSSAPDVSSASVDREDHGAAHPLVSPNSLPPPMQFPAPPKLAPRSKFVSTFPFFFFFFAQDLMHSCVPWTQLARVMIYVRILFVKVVF